MPLSATPIYWLDLNECWPTDTPKWRLGIMGRLRSGDWLDEEITSLCGREVQVFVNTLEYGEAKELGLQHLDELLEAKQITTYNYPIANHRVPESALHFARLLDELTEHTREERSIVVHCRQGVGRASVVAAGLLEHMGIEHEHALETISSARGKRVPETTDQDQWLKQSMQTINMLRQDVP